MADKGRSPRVGVVNANELACLRELALVLFDSVGQLHHRAQALVLPTQRCQLLGILGSRRVREIAFDFGGASYGVRETVAEAQADFPAYF